jgi:hypothetical protein
MTRVSTLTPSVTKELRALFPVWLASVVTIAVGAMSDSWGLQRLALAAYGLGTLGVGAQSIGHEYSHRTLGTLLAQPIDRRRLLLAKVAVLIPMIVSLGAIAWLGLSDKTDLFRTSIWRPSSLAILVAACGLSVAPWLTMVCRSPLAAVVFSVAAPMVIVIAGELLALARYGMNGGIEIDTLKLSVVWWGTLGLCGVASVSGWRTFMRLEFIEGRSADVALPWEAQGGQAVDTPGTLDARIRPPVWLLVKKELRLQQMTFVVVGLYILWWAAFALLERFAPELPRLPIAPLTVLYFGLLSLLIGSLASAEERQLGTLDWQMLLPMAAWRQWAMKAGITLALAIVLGIGLPTVLLGIHGSGDGFRGAGRVVRETLPVVIVLTTSSLYVSSLCSSGIRAMVFSLPAPVGTLFLFLSVYVPVNDVVYRRLMERDARPSREIFLSYVTAQRAAVLLLAASLVALLLRYGLDNHRTGDRQFKRILTQAAGIAGLLTLGVCLLTGVTILFFWR